MPKRSERGRSKIETSFFQITYFIFHDYLKWIGKFKFKCHRSEVKKKVYMPVKVQRSLFLRCPNFEDRIYFMFLFFDKKNCHNALLRVALCAHDSWVMSFILSYIICTYMHVHACMIQMLACIWIMHCWYSVVCIYVSRRGRRASPRARMARGIGMGMQYNMLLLVLYILYSL
jgi:hypothetical protein